MDKRNVVSVLIAAFIATMLSSASVVFAGQTIMGGGSMRCEVYTESDDGVKFAGENWALGFLSSANLRAKNLDLLQTIDSVAIIAALEHFCDTHPGHSIADASMELLRELVASVEGNCSDTQGMKKSSLSRCNNPAAINNADEPQGWSMTVPAVE